MRDYTNENKKGALRSNCGGSCPIPARQLLPITLA